MLKVFHLLFTFSKKRTLEFKMFSQASAVQASAAQASAAQASAVDKFDALVSKPETLATWTIDTGGLCLCFLKKRNPGPTTKKIMTNVTKLLKCRTCFAFYGSVTPLVGRDGMCVFNTCTDFPNLRLLSESYDKSSGIPFLVTKPCFGTPKTGGFDHFHAFPDKISNFGSFSPEDIEWAIHQYSGLLERQLSELNQPGAIASIDKLLELLVKVPYGDKIADSTRWFKKSLKKYSNAETPFQRKLVVIESLFSGPFSKGSGSERMCFPHLFQWKNNTMQALKCADDEKALVAMLSARFDPKNYLRPTVEASDGQLDEAMGMFKNLGFKTEIMPIEELPKYGGVLVNQSPQCATSDAMSAFEKMRKNRNKTAFGFAGRCEPKHSQPTTASQLMTFLQKGKFGGLQVNCSGSQCTMTSQWPESSQEATVNRNGWCFYSGTESIEKVGIPKHLPWQKVSAFQIIGGTVLVSLSDARPTTNMMNTCFPVFLTSAYMRKCRSAFEELNKTEIEYDTTKPNGYYALGIGTSKVGEDGTLSNQLAFRYPIGSGKFVYFYLKKL